MRFILVTGLSGAGKTQALHFLEDMGYFCVDNLPPTLIPKFAELLGGTAIEKVAVVVDVRGGHFFSGIYEALAKLEDYSIKYETLFLESDSRVIINRFSENRRAHPLMSDKHDLSAAITLERDFLRRLRDSADHVIDTSALLPRELKSRLGELFSENSGGLYIRVQSFGFKRGLPIEADLVFDTRFLPNPFYIESLRPLTGMDAAVRDYVFSFEQTGAFVSKLHDMLLFLMPHYVQEGRTLLTVAIGCTGGMHRSVAVAEAIGEKLITGGYRAVVSHRDIKTEQERAPL